MFSSRSPGLQWWFTSDKVVFILSIQIATVGNPQCLSQSPSLALCWWCLLPNSNSQRDLRVSNVTTPGWGQGFPPTWSQVVPGICRDIPHDRMPTHSFPRKPPINEQLWVTQSPAHSHKPLTYQGPGFMHQCPAHLISLRTPLPGAGSRLPATGVLLCGTKLHHPLQPLKLALKASPS